MRSDQIHPNEPHNSSSICPIALAISLNSMVNGECDHPTFSRLQSVYLKQWNYDACLKLQVVQNEENENEEYE